MLTLQWRLSPTSRPGFQSMLCSSLWPRWKSFFLCTLMLYLWKMDDNTQADGYLGHLHVLIVRCLAYFFCQGKCVFIKMTREGDLAWRKKGEETEVEVQWLRYDRHKSAKMCTQFRENKCSVVSADGPPRMGDTWECPDHSKPATLPAFMEEIENARATVLVTSYPSSSSLY